MRHVNGSRRLSQLATSIRSIRLSKAFQQVTSPGMAQRIESISASMRYHTGASGQAEGETGQLAQLVVVPRLRVLDHALEATEDLEGDGAEQGGPGDQAAG